MNAPHPPAPKLISKKLLLTASAIADGCDFVTLVGGLGILSGPLWLLIDLPVTILHFLYAGPRAWVVLAEYVPGIGYAPCYTIAAMTYAEKDDRRAPVVEADIVSEPPRRTSGIPPRMG